MSSKRYPDLTDIFAKREAGRKARARMSMDEKLKVMDKLRAAADEFKNIRRQRSEGSEERSQKAHE